MNQRLTLAAVSAAQLASAVLGMVVALRRGHSFDVGFMRGHPDNVARESVFQGTALSAPITMLMTQAIATALVVRRASRPAVRLVAVLGGLNVPGYFAERLVRRRLTPSGGDRLESPLLLIGISLSAVLPLLARYMKLPGVRF